MMKKVFSNNIDIDKNAYMNWRTNHREPIQNMNVIADGYFESALMLAECCLKDNHDKKADAIIFSIISSANHAIELYEKAICWSLNILLGYKATFQDNHDIRGIWLTVREKIKEFGFSEERQEIELNRMAANLESYLDELLKKS